MQSQTSMQSILANIFRLDLLRLTAGAYEATVSSDAALISDVERFWRASVWFGNIWKAFPPCLGRKGVAII